MANYIYYNGELYHAQKKQHKYIARVRTANGKYRYFYTREEYNAYKTAKESPKPKKASKLKSKLKSVSKFFKNISKKISTLFKKSKKELGKTLSKGRKFVNEVIFGKKKGKKNTAFIIEEKVKKAVKYIAKIKLSSGKYRYFYDKDEYNRYLRRQEYQKNEPDFMKKVSKIPDEDDFTASAIMDEVNPKYSRYDDGTSMNCANCTTAYELRCRGYDVEAAEYENPAEYYLNGTDLRFDYYYKDAKSVYLDSNGDEHKSVLNGTNWQKEFDYSSDTVESSIVKHSGKNTRGDISVTWKSGGAHSMVYEVNNNGNVVIRDCQTNTVYSVEDIVDSVDNIRITRTDNLELKKGVLNAVADR